MSENLKLWRHARLATCDADNRQIEHGALLSRGAQLTWVGEERALPVTITPARFDAWYEAFREPLRAYLRRIVASQPRRSSSS